MKTKSHNYEIIIKIILNWWKCFFIKVMPANSVFLLYLPVTTHISSGPSQNVSNTEGKPFSL